jgi:hypothetical protein
MPKSLMQISPVKTVKILMASIDFTWRQSTITTVAQSWCLIDTDGSLNSLLDFDLPQE